MIEQAFHAYTKAVEAKFESSPTNKEGKVDWLNKEVQQQPPNRISKRSRLVPVTSGK